MVNPGHAGRLETFAAAGGTVVLTNRSGTKDKNGNCIVGEALPTVFRKLCGCHVAEYDPIGTVGEKSFCRTLLLEIFRSQQLEMLDTLPCGVESTVRSGADRTYRFFFNNTTHGQFILLDGKRVQRTAVRWNTSARCGRNATITDTESRYARRSNT